MIKAKQISENQYTNWKASHQARTDMAYHVTGVAQALYAVLQRQRDHLSPGGISVLDSLGEALGRYDEADSSFAQYKEQEEATA